MLWLLVALIAGGALVAALTPVGDYLSRDGAAVAIGEQTFASLVEPDVEFEFFRNDSDVVDLCIRKNGQLTHYAYRTKQPTSSMPSR